MMIRRPAALFLDLGGALLTNGWDRSMRRRAAETFGLDPADMDERHHLASLGLTLTGSRWEQSGFETSAERGEENEKHKGFCQDRGWCSDCKS